MTGNWDQMEANEIPFARMFYGQPRKFVDLQSYFDKRIEVNQYMEEVKADKITGAEKSRIREAYNISKAVDKSLRGLRESEKKAEKIELIEINIPINIFFLITLFLYFILLITILLLECK